MVNAGSISALPGDGGARTIAELIAQITSAGTGPVAPACWRDGKLVTTMLNTLVREGFVKRLVGDEVRFQTLRTLTAEDCLRLDVELYRRLGEDEL